MFAMTAKCYKTHMNKKIYCESRWRVHSQILIESLINLQITQWEIFKKLPFAYFESIFNAAENTLCRLEKLGGWRNGSLSVFY